LSACASKADVIEIAAEDLTRVRVLQDRLGQSHRMEAVGRVASEVALTCGRLLNDVRQHAQQWLLDGGSNVAPRHQGELLLQDLNRAADYLQKLVAYSDKQVSTPTLVELNTLMRDLAPVLKHVAGDDVEIQLPNASAPLNVDVETERVERLLVNLAAYGRERMPFGGSLTIELGTIVVDQRFTAKYPNVRPGPHALITVTENRRQARADNLLQLRDGSSARTPLAKPTQKPAMDLGTLQGLVGQCGGHLWMRLQPLGDIVAKIRLPLVTSYDQAHARAAAAGSGGRSLTRWFHI
jgi:two-component system cell cycle sensor histidine kinase/response regulator CckA